MPEPRERGRTAKLTLAALGIVYGDIGTSPLYAVKEVFAGAQHAVPIGTENVLGILSLFFWSLFLVVTIKYVSFLTRVSNRGEGGVIALMTLALRKGRRSSRSGTALVLLGLAGASLFYGDGVITPAISVLSAVEGLETVTPFFDPYIVPISLTILVSLFLFQRMGTARVGALFGPIMVIWFATLAVFGAMSIARHPAVLAAIGPWHAYRFLIGHSTLGFFALGAVVLCVTGAEALYADLGHFGSRPIRYGWLGCVMPALVINYFGQGALLLSTPGAADNPFYMLAPIWARYPLVVLATIATVIASQAVISGAFSITQQAIQLGYAPRLDIRHTSEHEAGQIYLPAVNWGLLVAVVVLVIGFGSSTRLASAYGIAVTGTMLITNVLATAVAIRIWKWRPVYACVAALPFVCIDAGFFLANAVKIPDGGWFPIAFGGAIFILLTTWKRGRELLTQRLAKGAVPLAEFVPWLATERIERIPGSAVFMTASPSSVPSALLHSLKHYRALHDQIIILSVEVSDVPRVPDSERVRVRRLDGRISQVTVTYGFTDEPDIPEALASCGEHGLQLDMMETTFFLGRATLIPKRRSDLAYWRALLFVAMFRNAGSATQFFRLPPNRVVELGIQVML
ncbi:MAG: potassium transporter Kup [Betaproteobacteria bacterium]|nr:potassium transporter Kup [Betaproteobacteria bacterium]